MLTLGAESTTNDVMYSKTERRDTRISFRLTPAMRQAAEVCAAADKRSLSDWIALLIEREAANKLRELKAQTEDQIQTLQATSKVARK